MPERLVRIEAGGEVLHGSREQVGLFGLRLVRLWGDGSLTAAFLISQTKVATLSVT